MNKLFAIIILLMILTSCNNKPIIETPNNIKIDTAQFHIDTVKVMKMKHLTASNLYGLHCKMCHGGNGKGDGIKARTDITICPYDLTKVNKPDKEVYYVVLNGKKNMPNQYELRDSDVWVIVFYIKKFKKCEIKIQLDSLK